MSDRKVVGYWNITAAYTNNQYPEAAYQHTEKVKELLVQGWEPLGPLTHISGDGQSLMCQTMVKYDTNDWIENLLEHLNEWETSDSSSQEITIRSNGEWYISYVDSEGIETTGFSGSDIETLRKVLGEQR